MTTYFQYRPNKYGTMDRKVIDLRTRVAETYGTLCCWCGIQTVRQRGKKGTPLPDDYRTLEHLVRRADGGSNTLENCRIACRKCNNERHNYPKTPKITAAKPQIIPVSAAVGELFLAIRT